MRHESEIIISQTCNLNHHPQIGFTMVYHIHQTSSSTLKTSGRYLLLCRPDDFMMLGGFHQSPRRRIFSHGGIPKVHGGFMGKSSRNPPEMGSSPAVSSCFHVYLWCPGIEPKMGWFLIKCLGKKDGWIGSSEQSFLGEPFRVYPYRITTFWLVVSNIQSASKCCLCSSFTLAWWRRGGWWWSHVTIWYVWNGWLNYRLRTSLPHFLTSMDHPNLIDSLKLFFHLFSYSKECNPQFNHMLPGAVCPCWRQQLGNPWWLFHVVSHIKNG